MKLRIVLLLLLCGALGKVHAVKNSVYTIPQSKHLGIVGVVKRILDYFVKPGPDSVRDPSDKSSLTPADEYNQLWQQAQDAFNIPKKDRVPIVWREDKEGYFARYYSRSCVVLNRSSLFHQYDINVRVHILMHEAAHHKRALEGTSVAIPKTILLGATQSLFIYGTHILLKKRALSGRGLGFFLGGLVGTMNLLLTNIRAERHEEYEADRLSLATPCYFCAQGASNISHPDKDRLGYVPQTILLRHARSLQKHHMCIIHRSLVDSLLPHDG